MTLHAVPPKKKNPSLEFPINDRPIRKGLGNTVMAWQCDEVATRAVSSKRVVGWGRHRSSG